jgi:hypothetical protein
LGSAVGAWMARSLSMACERPGCRRNDGGARSLGAYSSANRAHCLPDPCRVAERIAIGSKRAVKPTPRPHWNDAYGTDSGPSRGDPCTPGIRPTGLSGLNIIAPRRCELRRRRPDRRTHRANLAATHRPRRPAQLWRQDSRVAAGHRCSPDNGGRAVHHQGG